MTIRTILIFISEAQRSALSQPKIVNSFDGSVRKVLDAVDKVGGFGLLRDAPEIRAYPSPDLDCQRSIESVYTNPHDRQAIRIVAYDEADNFDPSIFEGSKLCVGLKMGSGKVGISATHRAVRGSIISISPADLLSALSDIQLDIAFANSESLRSIIRRAIDAIGHQGLYQRKVQFYRDSKPETYLGAADVAAGYAPISAMARSSATSNGELVEALSRTWDEFVWTRLTEFVPSRDEVAEDLRRLPKIGSQLGLKALRRAIGELESGTHRLVVLRRSLSVRKTPEIRNTLAAIFGRKAEPGDVRILDAQEAQLLRRHPNLASDGWIAVRRFHFK